MKGDDNGWYNYGRKCLLKQHSIGAMEGVKEKNGSFAILV